jgi:hypothetical protein
LLQDYPSLFQGEPPLLQVNLSESLVTIINYSHLLQVDLLWLKGDSGWNSMDPGWASTLQDEPPWLQGNHPIVYNDFNSLLTLTRWWLHN